jgi:hypothetical protein
VLVATFVAASLRQRVLQQRSRSRAAFGEEHGQAVEEQVAGVRRPVRRWSRASGGRVGRDALPQPPCVAGPDQGFEMRVACEVDVERLELSRGVQQQERCGVVGACVPREQRAQADGERALHIGQWPLLCRRDQRRSLFAVAGQPLESRRAQRSLRPQPSIRRQLHGALEERSGRGKTAARSRAVCGALEVRCHVLVRGERGIGAMPRAAVGVELAIDGVRERPMHRPSLLGERGAVNRGAQQRMAERHARVDRDQLGRLCGRSSIGRETDRCGGSPEQRRIAERLGRSEQ